MAASVGECSRNARSTGRVLGRFAAYAAAAFASLGGVVGLVVGLHAYPPTAWFAVIEVGLPCALVGGALGAGCGAFALGIRSVWTERPLAGAPCPTCSDDPGHQKR